MTLPESGITIKELQQYCKTKDFNPGMEHGYFLKLIEETGELAEAIRKEAFRSGASIKGTIDEELYDVLYYVLALANIYDIDMEQTVRLKEKYNSERTDR